MFAHKDIGKPQCLITECSFDPATSIQVYEGIIGLSPCLLGSSPQKQKGVYGEDLFWIFFLPQSQSLVSVFNLKSSTTSPAA